MKVNFNTDNQYTVYGSIIIISIVIVMILLLTC